MGMGMGTELGWGQEQWGQVLDHVQLSIVESTKNESRSVLVFFFFIHYNETWAGCTYTFYYC